MRSYPKLGAGKELEEVWFGNSQPIGECPEWIKYHKGIIIHVPVGAAAAYMKGWNLESNFLSADDFKILEGSYKR